MATDPSSSPPGYTPYPAIAIDGASGQGGSDFSMKLVQTSNEKSVSPSESNTANQPYVTTNIPMQPIGNPGMVAGQVFPQQIQPQFMQGQQPQFVQGQQPQFAHGQQPQFAQGQQPQFVQGQQPQFVQGQQPQSVQGQQPQFAQGQQPRSVQGQQPQFAQGQQPQFVQAQPQPQAVYVQSNQTGMQVPNPVVQNQTTTYTTPLHALHRFPASVHCHKCGQTSMTRTTNVTGNTNQ
ncbi:hypothetical protein V8E54_013420 [Elaphomyces granulatus]